MPQYCDVVPQKPNLEQHSPGLHEYWRSGAPQEPSVVTGRVEGAAPEGAGEHEVEGTGAFDDEAEGTGTVDDEAEGTGALDEDAEGTGTVVDEAEGTGAFDDEAEGSGTVDDEADGTGTVDDEADGTGTVDDDAEGNGEIEAEHRPYRGCSKENGSYVLSTRQRPNKIWDAPGSPCRSIATSFHRTRTMSSSNRTGTSTADWERRRSRQATRGGSQGESR